MTRTRHVGDEALIALVARDVEVLEVRSHLDRCDRCTEELRHWQKISDAARTTVSKAPRPGASVAEQIFSEIDRPISSRGSDRPVRKGRTVDQRWRWVIPAPILLAAVALILAFGVGSTPSSSAAVLMIIRSSPAVAAQLHEVGHWTESEVLRAPQGYVAIEYQSRGTFDSGTGAFETAVKTVEPGGPSLNAASFVSDGSIVYLPCNDDWQVIGKKPCIGYPVQRGAAAPSVLGFLRAAKGPVEHLGSREIDGVQTTGYRVTVPVSALVQAAMPSERSLVEIGNGTTVSDVRVAIWTDNRGLAREVDDTWVQRQTSLPTLLYASSTTKIRYAKGSFHPATPERSAVTFAPDVQSALFLQSLYQNALASFMDSQTY